MKEITCEQITEAVRDCIKVSYDLPQDVESCLKAAQDKEESPFGKYCLEQIVNNAELARDTKQAMCQDTGMAVIYLEVGQDVHITGGALTDARACARATKTDICAKAWQKIRLSAA